LEGHNAMGFSSLGVGDVLLLLAVIIFNCSIANMWQILYGNWHKMTPIWKWYSEYKTLKQISKKQVLINLGKNVKLLFMECTYQ